MFTLVPFIVVEKHHVTYTIKIILQKDFIMKDEQSSRFNNLGTLELCFFGFTSSPL